MKIVLKGIGLLGLFIVLSFLVFVVVIVDRFWLKLLLFKVIKLRMGINKFIIKRLILLIVFDMVIVFKLLKMV